MKKLLIALSTVLLLAAGISAQEAGAKNETAVKPTNDCVNPTSLEKRLEEMDRHLKDWPELARYQEANSKLAPSPKDEERVVFMGDSITDSWSNPQFGGFFPGKSYVNRGISGQTTPQMLIRFRPDVIALQPRAVVILAGTNDIAGNTGPMTLEETEGNLASMAELAHAHGIRVVLSSVMPVSDLTGADGKKIIQTGKRPPGKILAVNEWIKKFSAADGDVYLDYFSAVVDENGRFKAELTYDGLHPNTKGYAVMAPLAEKAIHEALGNNPEPGR
jgi:lysophospholipase L1-like esterase